MSFIFKCCKRSAPQPQSQSQPQPQPQQILDRVYSSPSNKYLDMIFDAMDKNQKSLYDSIENKSVWDDLINVSVNEFDEIMYNIETHFEGDFDKIFAYMKERAQDERMLFTYVVDLMQGHQLRRKQK